jgi:GNAT superfamily N-acetyltransferase
MLESEPAKMLLYRPMHVVEAEAAARLHRRVGRATWQWTPDLSTPAAELAMYRETVFARGTVVGAFDGAVLRGFVATIPGWIEHLYVDVDCQGLGMGSALLERAMTSADDLQLWTYQANTATRRFYERRGFVVAEMTDGASLAEREPNVRYRWQR